ncbi:AAA family ATPase [Citrobacter freundii]|nr:ATP-binding protein [Citrobacter freundii]MBA8035649.1 AAA family ATPase [Citrobacter freundii]
MLKSVYISNFKGLKEISIPSVGNLNLIVGKNNSGKSSLLEALMLYASGGSESVLHELSVSHDEVSRERFRPTEYQQTDSESQSFITNEMLPYEHLFYGRTFDQREPIHIGESESERSTKSLVISFMKDRKRNDKSNDEAIKLLKQLNIFKDDIVMPDIRSQNVLEVKKGKSKHFIPLDEAVFRTSRLVDSDDRSKINFRYVPTKITSMDDLGILWDQITLTQYEKITIEALQSIEPNISDIRFILKDGSRRQRTAIVKLSGSDDVFPILSMGDGIGRILQLILNMYAARDGIYLIDEFDNGLHYSIQKSLWKMIFNLSKVLNVQVFATTHSWDCVQSFSEVSIENKDLNGFLLKLGKSKLSTNKGNSIVTIFNEDKLYTITQEMVEVR